MARLIDADKLIEEGWILERHGESNKLIGVKSIADVPTVEAKEVVHAKWIHLGGDEWCCTECGYVISTEGSWEKPKAKFCEECGADMRTSAE